MKLDRLGQDGDPHKQRALDARLRVAALVALVFGLANATPPGTTGRHLAALLLTVTTGAAWTGWLVGRYRNHLPLSAASLLLLAGSGGGLAVLSPTGVAIVALASMSAATLLDTAVMTAVATVGPATAAVGVATTGHPATVIVGAATGGLAGLVIGLARRGQLTRVEHAAELGVAEQRAQLEHERAEVLSERNRIAREVHDVLAHSLSALSVQMEALDSLLDDQTIELAEVQRAVQSCRGLVVEGLEETRRAVRVLRDEPVAIADQLRALAATDQVSLVVMGVPRLLPPAAGLALLRAGQEAVTNARKHAPGAAITITLSFDAHAATVVVDNTTVPTRPVGAAVSGGYGLRGMRERLELLGGSVTVGDTATGWQVHAQVPT